ncbi:class II aldolase/adducin family protein [Candidatus Kaiserbacteria bacterium]|nr:class II aldolase/adducin family protein [Candidatus Kaiserbacteria bacterium]
MMSETEARQKMEEILHDLWDRGHANTTGVSVSIRLDDGNILVDQTGAGFRKCRVAAGDFLIIDLNGNLVRPAPLIPQKLAPVNTGVHLAYYKNPLAQACIHAHAPYSQVFACRGETINPYTLQSQILGEVLCIHADDADLKKEYRERKPFIEVPSGLHARPDVWYVMQKVAELTAKALEPRNHEMEKHGLAITHYQHGIFVFGRNLDEAFDNLERVEANARTIIFSRMMGQI